MRAVNRLATIILFLSCSTCSALANAIEIDVQLEQVSWKYQELERNTARFPNTLPSSAKGNSLLAKLRLSNARDLPYFIALSGSFMQPTSWSKETWNTAQTNDLNISQQDIRLDMQYRLWGARWGMWLSQRKQSQQRRNFYLNNVLTVQPNEPIPETISSSWFGLSLTSVGGNMKQFETMLDIAIPLAVKVTNPQFSQPFSKKDGRRAGIHFRWLLPEREVALKGLNVTLRVEYQELGGEIQTTGGYWPYNQWLMGSIGMLYAW